MANIFKGDIGRKDRLVKYHSREWSKLILAGWQTIWVYRFGLAIMRLSN